MHDDKKKRQNNGRMTTKKTGEYQKEEEGFHTCTRYRCVDIKTYKKCTTTQFSVIVFLPRVLLLVLDMEHIRKTLEDENKKLQKIAQKTGT